MDQVQRLEELKGEMEVANREYREALAEAGQLIRPGFRRGVAGQADVSQRVC